MRKLLASVLAITLVFSMTACGGNDEIENTETLPVETTSDVIHSSGEVNPSDEVNSSDGSDSSEVSSSDGKETEETQEDTTNEDATNEGTFGSILLAEFNSLMGENSEQDALAIAQKLAASESIGFQTMTMEVEPGLLAGFDNYEVTGFEQGVTFAPMIGSIAFVGYVFVLPEDADVDTFVTGLKENSNPRWNICVEADETVVEANGNTVFFVMCPSDFAE